MYRFIPRSVDRTEMEVLWLVHADAIAGRDYDVERLSWLWQVTSLEDKQIIERNQQGVNSRYYEPGPYSLQEDYARRFVEWYLDGARLVGQIDVKIDGAAVAVDGVVHEAAARKQRSRGTANARHRPAGHAPPR